MGHEATKLDTVSNPAKALDSGCSEAIKGKEVM